MLANTGIKTDVQSLAHIIMWAELEGLICSGPRRGKQFTYALLEERVEKAKKLSREHALDKLALKYFTSHGPAQLKDFSWWSGLTVKDTRDALDLTGSKLEKATVNGKKYWFSTRAEVETPESPSAYLLSIMTSTRLPTKTKVISVRQKRSKK